MLIHKWVLTKLAMIKEKQCSMTYEDSINKQKGMEYRRNTLEETGKPHSCLLQKSSAIDAMLYSSQNMNTVREELCLFDDQFKMIFEVHE